MASQSGKESGDLELIANDDLSLHCQFSIPDQTTALAIVVHGAGEHIGRYTQLTDFLNSHHIACVGYDHRGHGKSSGYQVYVDKFADYVSDLDSVVSLGKERLPDIPVFLIGHSLGSIVVLRYASRFQDKLNGIITLAAPTQLSVPIPAWQRLLVKGMSKLVPRFLLPSPIDPSTLSNDPDVADNYMADDLNHFKVTARWLDEFLSTHNIEFSTLDQISLPVLMLHGQADAIAHHLGSEKSLESISSTDKGLQIYSGLKHELLNEREVDRDRVMKDIVTWIMNHV
jgi:alpha-beta hydrolase superfamily lysophospholipase|tara:strand:+ start:143 stop:997 length:855 start_codon:yes stop_codon:yes gene_type:complete